MEQSAWGNTRLLIVDEKAEEAMRLVNVFHDAGQTTRAEHITSVDALEKAFLERIKWDLLIISKLPNGVELASILEIIEQQSTDIPIIIIADYKSSSERMEYLVMGIGAVVPSDNKGMLLLKANIEINNMHMRRNYRRMSVSLHESERQRRLLLDDEVDAVVYIRDSIIQYANPAFARLVGKDEAHTLEGEVFSSFVKESDDDLVSSCLKSYEESGQALAVLQFSLIIDNDNEKPVRAIIKPTSYNNEFTLSLEIIYNNNKHKGSNLEVVKQAGFLKKKEFFECLDIDIQKGISGKGAFTLLYISIDGFQNIKNDKGEDVCIAVEKNVIEQMKEVIDEEYVGVALGSGQYSLLINVAASASVEDITQQIFKETAIESKSNQGVNVSLNIGAITLGDKYYDAKTIMTKVKHACLQSEKTSGENLTYYKERKVGVIKSVDKYLAVMLGQALKKKELKLYYQPVVSLKGSAGSCNYYEVSLSMIDSRGREHQAEKFRNKIDNKSIWSGVDRWQLNGVIKVLLDKRVDGVDTRVFVPVGGCALKDEKFSSWLADLIKKSGLPASALVIQVSESNVCRYNKIAPAFFDAVKANGFCTSISEFGCSVSPLKIIDSLSIDFIRIDPSFTQDFTTEECEKEFNNILKSVTKEGRRIIVPNVKDTAALASLWHSGVDYVQGNFLQKPAVAMSYKFENDF